MNNIAEAASLSTQLNQLEQASLIRLSSAAPDLEYIFRHALIQDSAYQTLVRADRRRVHAAAGTVLEALLAGGEPPPGLALQLAQHFDEAADYPRALRYYNLAADAALAGYANAEAVALYTRALSAAERAPAGAVEAAAWQRLYEARGRALELSNRYSEALANYQALARRAEALGDRRLALAAAVAVGQLYATSTPLFDLPRGEQMAEAALAEARALGDEPAEAKILWNLVNLYRHTERNAQARVVGERSLEIAQRLNLTQQAALTLNDLVHIYAALGLWPEVARASAEVQQRWRALGNVVLLADSLSTVALYEMLIGELALAIRHAEEAYQLTLSIGNLWGQTYSLLQLIEPYWYTGQPGRALETARECIRVAALGWAMGSSVAQASLAFIMAELGQAAAGLALVQPEGELAGFPMLPLAARVLLQARSGALEAARASLAAMEHNPAMHQPLIFFVPPILRARSAVAAAEVEAAATAGENAAQALAVTQAEVTELRAGNLLTALPLALIRLAQAQLLHGRVAEAREHLLAALAQARGMGTSMAEWQVLYALGGLERAHGDPARAQPYWDQARAIVTVIAGRIPTPALRQSFLARPELRALLGDAVIIAPEGAQPPG